tara:strand:- start:6088 stop:6411 length:324 start_codon:yes stop_codon:yes gene_type:complete
MHFRQLVRHDLLTLAPSTLGISGVYVNYLTVIPQLASTFCPREFLAVVIRVERLPVPATATAISTATASITSSTASASTAIVSGWPVIVWVVITLTPIASAASAVAT